LKGRLSLDKINSSIKEINRIFEQKYSLLSGNPNKMKPDLRQLYYDWKILENDDTPFPFITETDIKSGKFSSFKIDQNGKAILTILRHLGRIKEDRNKNCIKFIKI
jgi:hypothetical protein